MKHIKKKPKHLSAIGPWGLNHACFYHTVRVKDPLDFYHNSMPSPKETVRQHLLQTPSLGSVKLCFDTGVAQEEASKQSTLPTAWRKEVQYHSHSSQQQSLPNLQPHDINMVRKLTHSVCSAHPLLGNKQQAGNIPST